MMSQAVPLLTLIYPANLAHLRGLPQVSERKRWPRSGGASGSARDKIPRGCEGLIRPAEAQPRISATFGS